MKLSTLLLLLSLQSTAHSFGQKTITIREQGTSLEKVLKHIEKQSGYRFVYSNDIVAGGDKVFLILTRVSLDDALKKLLDERKLTYKSLDDKFIIITKAKEQEPLKKINGRVINKETGQPVSDASVMIKGSQIGTTTNENGFFELEVDNLKEILVISSVGYANIEINIADPAALDNIVMSPLQSTLNDVVVIGYGTQKRKDLTGAVSSVKGTEIKNLPATSVTDALQGRIAGVEVVKNSAEPGSSATIIIRGVSSLNNKGPLYIVDGMRQQGDNFNLQDIATIDVLKDAAAASIYGAAAAGGVIIITTKKGVRNNGNPNINFSMRYGHTVPRSLQLLDRDEYVRLKRLIDSSVKLIIM